MAQRASQRLQASRDDHIRCLAVDAFIPDGSSLPPGADRIRSKAFLLGDDRRPDHYRMTLSLNPAAAAAYRAGDFSKLLPDPESDDWLEFSRAGKYIKITCAL